MRRKFRLALATIAATGSVAGLCALGTGSALAAPRPAASAPVSKVMHSGAGHLAFRIEKVKTSSMPARARAAMKAAGLKIPAATNYIAELVNLDYGKCVDANNAGSTAGHNGDKVQLWGCFDNSSTHPNQWWDYGPTGYYSQLTNLWGGATKVLDANDAGSSGGTNGDKIQIWSYLGGSNQFWLQ